MDNKIKFQSKGEEVMWNYISRYLGNNSKWKIIPHYYLPKSGFPYRAFVDFALFYQDELFIIIEVNGEEHYTPVFGKEQYEHTKKRDEDERIWCLHNHIWLLVYDWIDGNMLYNGNYWDVSEDFEDTVTDVENFGRR